MRRTITLLSTLLLTFLLATSSVFAANPHFIGTPSASFGSNGDLTVSFKAAGLGNVDTADFTLSADSADAYWQCFTRSGNPVQGVPKKATETDLVVTDKFPVRNGQTTGKLTLSAPAAQDLKCTGNQNARMLSVTYYNVVLSGEGLTYTVGTISWP
jgi:hypothetical protein